MGRAIATTVPLERPVRSDKLADRAAALNLALERIAQHLAVKVGKLGRLSLRLLQLPQHCAGFAQLELET